MNKIWSYIAAFFAGISVGLAVMIALVKDNISSIELGKIKQKGKDNVLTPSVIIEAAKALSKQQKKEARKEARQERREERKLK